MNLVTLSYPQAEMSSALQQLLDEQQVKSLLTRERYYRDTAQWQNLRDAYHPDASRTWIKITWCALLSDGHIEYLLMAGYGSRYEGDIDGFVSGSQEMAQGGSSSFHTISPVEVHFNEKYDKSSYGVNGKYQCSVPH